MTGRAGDCHHSMPPFNATIQCPVTDLGNSPFAVSILLWADIVRLDTLPAVLTTASTRRDIPSTTCFPNDTREWIQTVSTSFSTPSRIALEFMLQSNNHFQRISHIQNPPIKCLATPSQPSTVARRVPRRPAEKHSDCLTLSPRPGESARSQNTEDRSSPLERSMYAVRDCLS